MRVWPFKGGYDNIKALDYIRKKYQKKNLNIFIIGAGALANFVALSLASIRLGRITIFDQDKIEETNLNRQLLYFDAVGDHKAIVLKKRLKEIGDHNGYYYKLSFFDENAKRYFRWFRDKPDLLIDCVDNFKTRSLLNKFAAKYKIPLISGGTSPLAGQVLVYFPGYTSCLNCELDVDRLAAERERQQREQGGCTTVPEGSVVTTNQIIGGMMVGELFRILNGKNPTPGTIRYISADDDRVAFVPAAKPCNCHTNGVKLPRPEKKKIEVPSPASMINRVKRFFIESEL